jgi:hypothetical protein
VPHLPLPTALRHHRLSGQRQVIELPPPPTVEITEHRLYKSWCARCGRWHYAQVELAGQVIGHSRMGVRIASLIAYLRTTLRLPVRLIKEYLLTVHNLLLSTGEITDLLHRVAETEQPKQSRCKRLLLRYTPASEAAPSCMVTKLRGEKKGKTAMSGCLPRLKVSATTSTTAHEREQLPVGYSAPSTKAHW